MSNSSRQYPLLTLELMTMEAVCSSQKVPDNSKRSHASAIKQKVRSWRDVLGESWVGSLSPAISCPSSFMYTHQKASRYLFLWLGGVAVQSARGNDISWPGQQQALLLPPGFGGEFCALLSPALTEGAGDALILLPLELGCSRPCQRWELVGGWVLHGGKTSAEGTINPHSEVISSRRQVFSHKTTFRGLVRSRTSQPPCLGKEDIKTKARSGLGSPDSALWGSVCSFKHRYCELGA